ncbi:MAG: FAD-dependent oxidoreductase [Bacteroidia bacterium]|nr:FAD-dependent oxidoreductase [Bacteroidia bacterium]
MGQNKKILIIGGGVIGLFCAWFLREEGFEVTIIEREAMEEGCSSGNAGMIVPSHFIPLAAPGVVRQGFRWMMNPESPFYIRPRADMDLLTWGWRFIRAANAAHVQKSIPLLRDLNLESKRLYQVLNKKEGFDFGWGEKGILMLFRTEKAEEEESKTAEKANEIGIKAQIFSPGEVQALEPGVKMDIRGAAYYPGDAHLYPLALIASLRKDLLFSGVKIFDQTEVGAIRVSGKKISRICTAAGDFEPDEVVIAAGSWSGKLAGLLGIGLPMQGGKGYSFMVEAEKNHPQIPAIMTEARVTVTPMNGQLRFGGTLEIAGEDRSVNLRRVRGIVRAIPQYFPEITPEMPAQPETIWRGLRPCSPDGLPYIGRSKKYQNLVFATGHAMMGVSLAPVTGRLIADILAGKKTSIPLDLLAPERYSK